MSYLISSILTSSLMLLQHCAMENCTGSLVNASGGIWCATHYQQRGHLCHVKGCSSPLIAKTLACAAHQADWQRHKTRFGGQSMLTMRRQIRNADQNPTPWNPARRTRSTAPAHDDDTAETEPPARTNYFTPGRFYCIELMVNPCGVPVAWTLFDRSESPTQIISFINAVHTRPADKSQYYCIDKACQVVRRLVSTGQWKIFSESSRLIVDSYHYLNHRASDWLCRTWCNPAPIDGSAPNLVRIEKEAGGKVKMQRIYNTQVCVFIYFNSTYLLAELRHVSNSMHGSLDSSQHSTGCRLITSSGICMSFSLFMQWWLGGVLRAQLTLQVQRMVRRWNLVTLRHLVMWHEC